VNKAGAIFDLSKLDWMNGHYLRSLPLYSIAERARKYFINLSLRDEEQYLAIIKAARERCTLLPELAEYARPFLCPETPAEAVTLDEEASVKVLSWFYANLPSIDINDAEAVNLLTKSGIAELGIKGKAFYTPLRLALIGQSHGPDLATTFSILGLEECLIRLKKYLHQE
jgi:glutamyl/glutaminyl-tRNA synthetase